MNTCLRHHMSPKDLNADWLMQCKSLKFRFFNSCEWVYDVNSRYSLYLLCLIRVLCIICIVSIAPPRGNSRLIASLQYIDSTRNLIMWSVLFALSVNTTSEVSWWKRMRKIQKIVVVWVNSVPVSDSARIISECNQSSSVKIWLKQEWLVMMLIFAQSCFVPKWEKSSLKLYKAEQLPKNGCTDGILNGQVHLNYLKAYLCTHFHTKWCLVWGP